MRSAPLERTPCRRALSAHASVEVIVPEPGLTVGVKVKEIATSKAVWQNCTVQHSDSIGVVFEVERAIADAGGNVETVVSQVLVPWVNIQHVLLMEERT